MYTYMHRHFTPPWVRSLVSFFWWLLCIFTTKFLYFAGLTHILVYTNRHKKVSMTLSLVHGSVTKVHVVCIAPCLHTCTYYILHKLQLTICSLQRCLAFRLNDVIRLSLLPQLSQRLISCPSLLLSSPPYHWTNALRHHHRRGSCDFDWSRDLAR